MNSKSSFQILEVAFRPLQCLKAIFNIKLQTVTQQWQQLGFLVMLPLKTCVCTTASQSSVQTQRAAAAAAEDQGENAASVLNL